MANNSLLPCPFCGSSALFRPSLHLATILCGGGNGCSVLPSVSRVTFSEAQRAWNFRVPTKEPES